MVTIHSPHFITRITVQVKDSKWVRFELVRDYPYGADDLVFTLVKVIGINTSGQYLEAPSGNLT
jgi:hypothetical protein